MWAGWVHHSQRFGHAEALCKVGPEMPERRSKTSTVPVVWATFGIFLAWSKWFPVTLVTMDETWLYHYDPETKQQSMEWQHRGSPHPKKFWVQKSAGKILASNFWDQDGILLIGYLPKGQTISYEYEYEYYSSLLVKLKDILKGKCRGKVTKGVLFLHDNAPAHQTLATQKKLAYLGFQCLDHAPYSPDLAPSDYHLFSGLKSNWKVAIFLLTERHRCCGDLVGRTTFWIFFEWLAKVRAMGWEVYWASRGVCWINPEFGHCSLFPFWSGYGLICTLYV